MTAHAFQAQSAGYALHLQRLHQPSTARPSRWPCASTADVPAHIAGCKSLSSRQLQCQASLTAEVPTAPNTRSARGHADLLHGLGEVGDVPPTLMPWLLRLAHIRSTVSGGDSNVALRDTARGVLLWEEALNRGLLPDDNTLMQLSQEKDSIVHGRSLDSMRWPDQDLRAVLIRCLSQLDVARFAKKYPAVMTALLRSMLEVTVKYCKALLGEVEAVEERAVDRHGNKYLTIKELQEQEAQRRAVRSNTTLPSVANVAMPDEEEDDQEDSAAERASWSRERTIAETLAAKLILQWQGPISTLSRAGKAFEGLEALLGGAQGGGFDLGGALWQRKGWKEMDKMRAQLEDLRELRDLVRSLGRGGGWGPLRRAPVQYLDMKGRPGLLRTILEQQETRGLTRSDDISRLLPSEAATLARGRTVRQSKLLFYGKLAEKALQTYERDGWGEFPTQIQVERREIRPTADRGPILLCVDTSGSMRGPRETVAKALALECMRAAKAQERGCYVFAFAGPQEVHELELGTDMKSVNNLLTFLEKVFNGGSDFNEPIRRCLGRLTDAKWANSDILLVSDGELRQPGQDIMRKLSGAKDKLSLRVHGLIVGSPEKKRADPAVLRALCSHTLPSGKNEQLVTEFDGWASVRKEQAMKFDWDDAIGNSQRRIVGLALEAERQKEIKRKRIESRGQKIKHPPTGGRKSKAKAKAAPAASSPPSPSPTTPDTPEIIS